MPALWTGNRFLLVKSPLFVNSYGLKVGRFFVCCNHFPQVISIIIPSFQRLPKFFIGVWEEKKFIGCIIFSRGANANLGTTYGLEKIEVCELTRVALNNHKNTVSKILSLAIKMLKKKEEGLRLIVSYADVNHSHFGVIYQATNWIYTGCQRGGGYV